MILPKNFTERMERMLGDSAKELFFELEHGSAVKSFRINGIKTGKERFESSSAAIRREPLEFPSEGYRTDEEYPSAHPCHHAGAIYMQDPSAMSTLHAVSIRDGMKALDACAAPGGKTGQLSYLVGDSGAVIANEYDKKRCRILQSNLERMGCRNTVAVNLDTSELADLYPHVFDVVLCDAPCSGEGMFRKNERAIEEWSTENVFMCAERQKEILNNVARCVADGGILIYSTCTFSLEENEMNVEHFLNSHADFELIAVNDELNKHTSDGICFSGCQHDMTLTRRFYPHVCTGEGQFIAAMKRSGEPRTQSKTHTSEERINRETHERLETAERFLRENLTTLPNRELIAIGDKIYLKPSISLPSHGVFTAGVCVGETVKGRLVPHHQLFSAYGDQFKRRIELTSDMSLTHSYLKGLEIPCSDLLKIYGGEPNGWAAVLIDGCAAGGAKISGGTAKNHYPKGLREKQ